MKIKESITTTTSIKKREVKKKKMYNNSTRKSIISKNLKLISFEIFNILSADFCIRKSSRGNLQRWSSDDL